nr:hypothetical protein CFP56_66700 [Quercus suber]
MERERENLKRSDEEADTLARSTKKFKDGHQVAEDKEDNLHAKAGSYRDKLVGSIPGAFEKAFGFASDMQEDVVSDDEDEHAEDGSIRVCFSRDEKSCMRAPWYQALIIKPFGRRIGYSFLVSKIRSMWNTRGGRAIGPVLRIDANTANGARGRFARLCVQVNLEKPLVKSIFLGRLKQSIQYEGIGTLCFECGRIGHSREMCPFLVRENKKDVQVEQGSESQENQRDVSTTPMVDEAPASQLDEYGDWMLVTRRKPRNRARDKLNGSYGSQSDESSQQQHEKTLHSVGDGERAVGKRKAPHLQVNRSYGEEDLSSSSYHNKTTDGKGTRRKGARANSKLKANVTVGNQKSAMGLGKEKEFFVFGASAGPSKDFGPDQRFSSLNKAANTTARPVLTDKEKESSTLSFSKHGDNREVGVVLQGKDHSNVRLGADAGLEEFAPTDGREQKGGLPVTVEVCHGQSCASVPSTNNFKLVRDKFKGAALGKISNRGREEMVGNGDLCEEDSSNQACGMLYDGEYALGEHDFKHHSHQINNKGEGNNSPLDLFVPGEIGERGRGDGSMEIERH